MKILFLNQAPEYCPATLTVKFPAQVDDQDVDCAISVEALEDHFEVESIDPNGWLKAFSKGRISIEQVAREHLACLDKSPVLLKSGHFPPGSVLNKPPTHVTTMRL
jgi:hypothetical protein